MHVLIGTTAGVSYPQEGDAPAVKLADVARWNEFGTELIPPRPAFRVGAENAIKNNGGGEEKLIDKYLANLIDPKMTPSTLKQLEKGFMENMSKRIVREVKQIIKQGSTAPNAPSTVAKKGKNHPLMDTELLYDNVAAEVVK